jgi:hypothetical protein
MGSWGAKTFEDDDAVDWTYELDEAEDCLFLMETLKAVTERGDDYLEVTEASRALGAAEVVAGLKGAAEPDLLDNVKQWINQHQLESMDLVDLDLKAVQRIKRHSELKELWDESDFKEDWNAVILNLETRLKS